jgi:hypothetical protein
MRVDSMDFKRDLRMHENAIDMKEKKINKNKLHIYGK